jgi:ParB-like chromosome segregation protein Spo0J
VARRGSIPSVNNPNESFWVSTGPGAEEEPWAADVRDLPDQDKSHRTESARDDRVNGRYDQALPYPFHPLANVFPLLKGCQFDELVGDIRLNGLNQPIVLFDGAVLDGRNRLRACVVAGVPHRTVTFDGPDPIAHVVSVNLRRRHLSTSQRAMVAAELADMRQGARNDLAPNGATSQANAAGLLNVSRRSVQRAVALRENGDSALVELVKSGEMTASAAAAALAKLPPAIQKRIGSKSDREIRAATKRASTDNHAESQIRADSPDLFPDNARECAIKQARQRNGRSRWLPQTKEEQFAEWITRLTNSDEWLQVFERLKSLSPNDVIRALRKGPMLRLQP